MTTTQVNEPGPSAAEVKPVPVPARSFRVPTLLDRAISVALWGVGLALAGPVLPAMAIGCVLFGPDATMPLQRWYAKWGLKATFSSWRAVVHPKVDASRPYLFAHNHTNHLDFILMHNATPHYKQGVELEEHFKIPFYGWFMKARGGIPVKRGQKGQGPEVLAHCQRELDKNHAILVFPEGTRSLDGRVGRFRTGAFFIARDLGLPVCPVTVTGAFDLMRKGSLMVRPAELTVYVDEPIETAGLTDDEVAALAERVQRIVGSRLDDYWREKGWRP
jgi:1-acyl-sn-glycerol-3-phosphate acyltransferase